MSPPSAGIHSRPARRTAWPPAPAPQAADLRHAVALVGAAEPPTPMIRSPHLTTRYGRPVWLKLETCSPVRSFKYRGAVVALDAIAGDPRVLTVVTASTGNHGQGIAYAARRRGLGVVVVSPESAAPEKLVAMRELGADVRVEGSTLDESQRVACSLADADAGALYIEDGENADLMAGAATVVLEMVAARPQLETVVVPVGGGNLIAGTLLGDALDGNHRTIVGVQSSAAAGATASWLSGALVEAPCTTFAGGLATTRPGELALAVMLEFLDHVAVVDEVDLLRAMGTSLATTGIQIEGAAAATIAAIERFGDSIPGDEIGLVLTGNWTTHRELSRAVELMASESTSA
jgi:threonine dehydratase